MPVTFYHAGFTQLKTENLVSDDTLETTGKLHVVKELGDYRVYFYGNITINMNGVLTFDGRKEPYDYWNFDSKPFCSIIRP